MTRHDHIFIPCLPKGKKNEKMRFATSPLSIIAVVTILWNNFSPTVLAFSNGAGGCTAGNTAVQSIHLTQSIKTGSLATGGFSVTLGITKLVAGVPSTFPINTATSLTIAGTKSFKGFLMRLGEVGGVQTDAAFSVVTSGGIQISTKCTGVEGVGGVTHTSSALKSKATATLKVASAAASMPLDVTVVVVNTGGVSEYYYSQFKVSAGGSTTPLQAPSKKPSLRPTVKRIPTKKPTIRPTVKKI